MTASTAAQPTRLDWRSHKIGALTPCRLCGQKALCRDQNGHPCHKGCAERELDRVAAWAAGTKGRR